jgi:hypothetical protein
VPVQSLGGQTSAGQTSGGPGGDFVPVPVLPEVC